MNAGASHRGGPAFRVLPEDKKGPPTNVNASGPKGGILESFLHHRTASGGKTQGVSFVESELLLYDPAAEGGIRRPEPDTHGSADWRAWAGGGFVRGADSPP